MTDLSVLFQPGKIGKLVVKNRVVKSPQSSALSNPDGTVSQRTVNHYKRLAEGGTGLILLEYSYVDDDAAKSIHNQLGISRREHIAGLGWLVDEVHAAGAKVGVQLAHCGRQKFLATAPIKSASDVSWDEIERQYGVKPQPMAPDEIRGVVSAFGDAAVRAVQARFDIVEVHAGHGYLITNFLSPHTNRRTDEYGGSFDNRSRLLLEVVADIRKKIPRDFPLSIRLSVSDYEADGIPIAETVELCRRLESLGVDVIHASGGHHAGMEYEVSPWYMPRALHRWGWEQIKSAVSIPLIGSGSIVAPDVAADIVGSGSADFVSLGRPLLADPDWVRKTEEGRVQDIAPCIRCNDGCLHRGLNEGRSAGCTVNPSMGEEYRYVVEPSSKPQSIAVVGGGPAGMNAAMVLADRGHAVTLFDDRPLGGQLNFAVRSDLKKDLRALRDYLVHQVAQRNIQVIAARADAAQLRSGGFDRVLLATGTAPVEFDGVIDNEAVVVKAHDVSDPSALQGPIVIVGAGLSGCDTALLLGSAGRTDVTLLEEQGSVLANGYVFTDVIGMPAQLNKYNVATMAGTKALAIEHTGVRVRNAQGDETLVPAGTVILACGHVPQAELFEILKQELPEMKIDPVGTVHTGGRVMDALHDSFFLARRC